MGKLPSMGTERKVKMETPTQAPTAALTVTQILEREKEQSVLKTQAIAELLKERVDLEKRTKARLAEIREHLSALGHKIQRKPKEAVKSTAKPTGKPGKDSKP